MSWVPYTIIPVQIYRNIVPSVVAVADSELLLAPDFLGIKEWSPLHRSSSPFLCATENSEHKKKQLKESEEKQRRDGIPIDFGMIYGTFACN